MPSDSSQPRPALVSLVLLGILLVTVAAAWLMARFYYGPSREGTAILQEVRKQGLPKLWPQKRYVARFQRKDRTGRPLGGETLIREPIEGGFAGQTAALSVGGSSRRSDRVDEYWTVSNDLSEANYVAVYADREFQVRIELRDGQVAFRGRRKPVSTDAPANYIPEGLSELVIRQVARSGKEASFRLISNELSYQENTVAFIRMVLTPVSRQEVRCQIERGGGGLDMTYHLDAGGEVERIESGDGSVLTPLPTGRSTPPEEPSPPEAPADDDAEADPLVMAR